MSMLFKQDIQVNLKIFYSKMFVFLEYYSFHLLFNDLLKQEYEFFN